MCASYWHASVAKPRARDPLLIPRSATLAAAVLLIIFVLQAWIAARRDSVTIDEFSQVPVGLHMLRTGDFSLDPINPPLTRMIAALPLLLSSPVLNAPADTAHWGLGYVFMQQNRGDYQAIFVRARSMMIVFTSLLGGLVFVWAAQLYGVSAGLAALTLFAFSPNMLAYAHLATLDMSGALGATATAYATWRMLERPTARSAVILGVALGIATLLKLSGGVLIGTVILGVLVCAWSERGVGHRSVPWARLLCLSGLVALLTLNAGYGFQGTCAPLSAARLDPNGTLAALRNALPWLRIPVPLPLLNGVDEVLNSGKQQQPAYFLAGELSSQGWWYYHLAAFGLKTSVPLLVSTVWALAMWCAGKGRGRREYCVFIPVLLIFLANTVFNSLQIGVRHVLSVYPLLFIAVSPWIVAALQARTRGAGGALLAATAGAGLLWFVAGSLWVAPRYLQYFNELAGGPDGGHRFLIDSNIDWGQDLIRLHEYMDHRALSVVNLAYFGRVDPGVYGIRFVPLERGSHGPTVISATFLMGRPYFWYLGGQMRWVPPRTYTWLQQYQPVARVGSMFVFDLP